MFRRNIGALCTTAHPIQAKAAAGGKTLELPEAKYLCIKKIRKLK